MVNPFEDESGTFIVLTNAEGQHSLWPLSVAAPAGWETLFGPGTRPACLAYVEEHWADMRPKRLIQAMNRPATT
jgi:MbtH protein